MKRISVLMCLLSVSFGAHGAGWEGSLVKIKKGALLCDFFNMEAALLLRKSGDTASLQALIAKGSCLIAPDELIATVVEDASTFTDPDLAEVMVDGARIWGAMQDMNCCFKRQ
jgi:hypothetical protein